MNLLTTAAEIHRQYYACTSLIKHNVENDLHSASLVNIYRETLAFDLALKVYTLLAQSTRFRSIRVTVMITYMYGIDRGRRS